MKCSKCKEEKAFTKFYKRKSSYKYPSQEYGSWCKECIRGKNKKEYWLNRKEILQRMKERHLKNRDHDLRVKKQYYRKIRKEVIEHYGGKCACCGETFIGFLAIDHINNDGYKHKKQFGGSMAITYWLRQNKYPKGFQVLCHNCNMAKAFYGGCPNGTHKTGR